MSEFNKINPEFQASLNKQFKEQLEEIQLLITEVKESSFEDFTENSLIRMTSQSRQFKFFLKQLKDKS